MLPLEVFHAAVRDARALINVAELDLADGAAVNAAYRLERAVEHLRVAEAAALDQAEAAARASAGRPV